MRDCWLLLITKGLGVWMPPEVYLERGMASREANRWISVLSRRQALLVVGRSVSVPLSGQAKLYVARKLFPEQWRACPIWVGVRWSQKPGAAPRLELMAMDLDEATAWVQARSKRALDPGPRSDFRIESTWDRSGVREYTAAHRVKRFIGF